MRLLKCLAKLWRDWRAGHMLLRCAGCDSLMFLKNAYFIGWNLIQVKAILAKGEKPASGALKPFRARCKKERERLTALCEKGL